MELAYQTGLMLLLAVLGSLCLTGEGVPIHGRPQGAPLQSQDGTYKWSYDTRGGPGAQMFREESRNQDGTVTGTYGYVDPYGRLRQVQYRAGSGGFRAWGDTGVDYQTPRESWTQPPKGLDLSQLYPLPGFQPFQPPYLGIGRPVFLIKN